MVRTLTSPTTPHHNEWIVLDFETASTRGTPCQVAAIRFRNGEAADSFSTHVFQRPEDFNEFNIALHGITPAAVARAPKWPDVHCRLVEFADGAPLIAHYAPYDMGVLRDACDLCELTWPTVTYACTVTIARRVWPGLSSYSLVFLCSQLGIPLGGGRHHDALYDARLAGAVLQRALVEHDVVSLGDLLDRVHIRLGAISPDGWHGSLARARLAREMEPAAYADPESPLYGKIVAFTGELAMVRREAWDLVAQAGGQPADNVTKKTDYLVCGYQDLFKLGVGETKSRKLRRAEQLSDEGFPVEILTERDFFRLSAGR